MYMIIEIYDYLCALIIYGDLHSLSTTKKPESQQHMWAYSELWLDALLWRHGCWSTKSTTSQITELPKRTNNILNASKI